MENPKDPTDDDLLGSTFDADLERQVQDAERDHKNRNLRNVFGSGRGRVAAIVFIVVLVGLMGFGFYELMSSSPKTVAAPSAASAVLNQPSQPGDQTVATDAEAAQRRKAISEQAQAAEAQGRTYIAPAVLKDDGAKPDNSITAAERERREMAARAEAEKTKQQPPEERSAAPAPVSREVPKDLEKQISSQISVVLGRREDGQRAGTFSTVSYAVPDRTVVAAQAAATSGTGSAANANVTTQNSTPIIGAGYGFYCEVRYSTNTDNARKDVVADCYQGPVNGATVIGKYELSPDTGGDPSVSISFDKLARKGKPTVAITAIALDDETEESGMADSVDEHGVKKYGGLAVASMLRGIGKAASMITGTQSTQTVGNVSTTTTATDPIDASRQLKITAGEVGTTFSDVLQKRSEAIKSTVKLRSKKPIRVVFLADVFESATK